MKKIVVLFALLWSVCTICFADAPLKIIKKDQLIATLQDKTMSTIYLTMFDKHLLPNSLILYFGKEGQVSGSFANKLDNGQPQKDQGLWDVDSSNALCVIWKHWNNGKKECVYVYDGMNSLIFIGLDGNYNALALKSAILLGNQLGH